MSDRSTYDDPLEKFTARDLCTALHWTSKQDLIDCLGKHNSQLWDNLIQADRNLQNFYPSDLATVIALNKEMMAKAEKAKEARSSK